MNATDGSIKASLVRLPKQWDGTCVSKGYYGQKLLDLE